MPSFPKPPPPIKNKGAKVYDAWRQGWLEREYRKNSIVVCETCRAVVDFITLSGGRWMYLYGRMTVGHRRGRLSHAEDKMSPRGVMHQCWKCNGEQAGQRNVLPRKVKL